MHLYPLQRILVCTDFSESSNLALKAAEELRKRSNGSIHVLHVSETGLELNDSFSGPETYRDVVLGGLKRSLEEKIHKQINQCGVQAIPLLKDGKIIEIVQELADEGNFDLIVMGHGRSPLMSQILGSTAYKLISATPLPLLLVKTPVKFGKISALIDESRPRDKVIIATFDFFKKFNFQDVGFISLWPDFPEPFGKQHKAAQMKDDLIQEINHFAPPGPKPEIIVEPTRELKLAVPLNKVLQEVKADVAVLKKFTDGNLKRIYLGSTSRRLLETFEGNLLIIPPTSHND